MLILNNFSFKEMGLWAGEFTFDHTFANNTAIARGQHRFTLDANGDDFTCRFSVYGPAITESNRLYTIFVDLLPALVNTTYLISHRTLKYNHEVISLEGSSFQYATNVIFMIKVGN